MYDVGKKMSAFVHNSNYITLRDYALYAAFIITTGTCPLLM